jgi:hypothetical protein
MNIHEENIREENRRIRILRIAGDLLVNSIMTRSVTADQANDMIHGVRSLALNLFPGKDEQFNLIYMPRFRRALREAGYYNELPRLEVIEGGKMNSATNHG